jgi:hypothetical protein
MSGAAGKSKPEFEFVVQPRRPNEPRVLSLGQQRLWYLDQLAPQHPAYNVPYASRLRGTLDADALQKVLDAVVGRHEVLRTVILAPRGTPVPLLLKKWSVELKQVDLRDLPESEREAEAGRVLKQECARPFNLARDLMLRAVVIRVSELEHIFLHIAAHMAFEGGSVGVFYRDLACFYNALLSGRPAELPTLSLQYCDYALWQRRYLQGQRLESLSKYWKQQLTGAPLVNLPLDFPRPAIHTMRGSRHFFVMPLELLAAANSFFRDSGTTPYRGLCAAFNVFLHCYTGQTDISLGSPFGSRCSGVEDIIGFFVNTVVLRTNLSGDPTFRELMKRVDDVVRGAIEHADLTFDKLVEAVQPPRDSSRTPLFQVNFRAPKQPYPSLQLRGLTAEPAQYIDNSTSKFDLALEIESSRGEACYVEYCVDLFKEETIVEMVEDFQNVLRCLIAEPDISLGKLPLLKEITQRIRNRGGIRH